jgi:hypothetical protein
MKGGRRTAKGRIINIDDVIAASPHSTAVGNMNVNAQGDELGPGGEVVKTREQRTRAYYKDHPQSSNRKVSLKGDMPGQMTQSSSSDFAGLKPDTADTGFENVRTQDQTDYDDGTWVMPEDMEPEPIDEGAGPLTDNPDLTEPEAPEPEEFDDVEMPPQGELDENGDYVTEPTGYREVEQENGDIVMQPYWDDDNES